jgi:hypothetical protein
LKAHITELLAQAAKSLMQNAYFDASSMMIQLERPKIKTMANFLPT